MGVVWVNWLGWCVVTLCAPNATVVSLGSPIGYFNPVWAKLDSNGLDMGRRVFRLKVCYFHIQVACWRVITVQGQMFLSFFGPVACFVGLLRMCLCISPRVATTPPACLSQAQPMLTVAPQQPSVLLRPGQTEQSLIASAKGVVSALYPVCYHISNICMVE
jgi:hypothetical protein